MIPNQPIKKGQNRIQGSVVNRTLKRKVYTGGQLYKIKDKEKVMSFQVNETRNEWIEYLVNFTEVWGKIIETKKGKEAEYYLCQDSQHNTEAQKVRPTMVLKILCT